MPEYPIFRGFETVGSVTAEKDGLYFCLYAVLSEELPGFPRLYFHRPGASLRLGLFSLSDGLLRCTARISARTLGEVSSGRFSLSDVPWVPSGTYSGALEQRMEQGRVLLFSAPSLPTEILPKFCFLCPSEEKNCFLLTEDADGNPFFPPTA